MIKLTNKDSIKIQTRKNTNSIWIKIILVQKSAYHTRTMLMATLTGKSILSIKISKCLQILRTIWTC